MYAALLIFHLLVARNLIESMVFRKFSLFDKPAECLDVKKREFDLGSEENYICDG